MSTTKESVHPFLDAPTPLALAHRGGALYEPNVGIENTIAAFTSACELGYTFLETDVYATADGVVYAFHDETLDRVTESEGLLAMMQSVDVDRALISGKEPIPRLAELLTSLPDARFNIDLKADAVVEPTLAVIEECGAQQRVCLASFDHTRLMRARRLAPWAATSASPQETVWLKFSPLRRFQAYAQRRRVVAFQVPHRRKGVTIVTRGFVKRAHRLGIQVHVWTVDDPAEMTLLLDLGVDGIVTDRIEILKDILIRRGQWRAP